MQIKSFGIIVLICAPFFGLSAKKYNIQNFSGDENIICTIDTQTQYRLSELIGEFDPFYVTGSVSETIGQHHSQLTYQQPSEHHTDRLTTQQKIQIDPFHTCLKTRMAVRVTIENNSDEEITVSRDEYLDGIPNFYVPKKMFAYEVFDLFKKYILEKYNSSKAIAILTSLPTVIPLVISLGAIFSFIGNGQDDGAVLTAIISGAFGLTFSPIFLVKLFQALEHKKLLDQVKGNELKLLQQTLKKTKNNKKISPSTVIYSQETGEYEIPPHSTFHDIFFVDLLKVERDVFETQDLPILKFERPNLY